MCTDHSRRQWWRRFQPADLSVLHPRTSHQSLSLTVSAIHHQCQVYQTTRTPLLSSSWLFIICIHLLPVAYLEIWRGLGYISSVHLKKVSIVIFSHIEYLYNFFHLQRGGPGAKSPKYAPDGRPVTSTPEISIIKVIDISCSHIYDSLLYNSPKRLAAGLCWGPQGELSTPLTLPFAFMRWKAIKLGTHCQKFCWKYRESYK